MGQFSSVKKVPFLEWLNGLKSSVIQARVRLRIERLCLGLYGDFKVIKGMLCELRLDFGAGYRIYFIEDWHPKA
jgi:putative addiction module killer protein